MLPFMSTRYLQPSAITFSAAAMCVDLTEGYV
jgi:hypothetical protein